MYLGDFTPGAVVRHKFFTEDATGAPITLAGTPAAKAYKQGSTSTEVTTGVTLTVDFDSLTGLHEVAVDTSADGTFYAAAADFFVVLTAGTVNGISAIGKVLAHFSLSNRSAGSAPSAAAIASAVRTELTTELGRVDAAVSTRATPAQVNTEADTAISDAALATAANLAIVAGYIDTEVAAIKAKTDNLPASPAAVGSAMTLSAAYDAAKTAATQTSVDDLPTNAELATALASADAAVLAAIAALSIPTAAQNAAGLLDLANGIETGVTPRQALRLMLSAMAGKVSGAATTTITFRNVGDSKDRITATVDADGNRTAVTTDAV